MGDTAGQAADRLHFLGLLNAGFHFLDFGNITKDTVGLAQIAIRSVSDPAIERDVQIVAFFMLQLVFNVIHPAAAFEFRKFFFKALFKVRVQDFNKGLADDFSFFIAQ